LLVFCACIFDIGKNDLKSEIQQATFARFIEKLCKIVVHYITGLISSQQNRLFAKLGKIGLKIFQIEFYGVLSRASLPYWPKWSII
jgi:hypothetical protein